jgi:hypothetical protein
MRSRNKSGAKNGHSTALARRTKQHFRRYVDPGAFEGACDILQLAAELATARVGVMSLADDLDNDPETADDCRRLKELADHMADGIGDIVDQISAHLISNSVRHIPSHD